MSGYKSGMKGADVLALLKNGLPIVDDVSKLDPNAELGSMASVVTAGSIQETSFRNLYQADASMLDQTTGTLTQPELLSSVSSVTVFAPADINNVGFTPVQSMIYLVTRDLSQTNQNMAMIQIEPSAGVMAMTITGGYDTMQQYTLVEYSQDTMSYIVHTDQVEAFNAVLANGMDWCYFGNPETSVITEEQFNTIDLFCLAVASVPSKVHVYLKKDNWKELYEEDFKKVADNLQELVSGLDETKRSIPTKVSQLENDLDFASMQSLPSLHSVVTTEEDQGTINLIAFKSNIYYAISDQYKLNSPNGESVLYLFTTPETVITFSNGEPELTGFESGLYKFVIRKDDTMSSFTKEKVSFNNPVFFAEYPAGEIEKVANSSTLSPYKNGAVITPTNVVFESGDTKLLLIAKDRTNISGISGDEYITKIWALGAANLSSNLTNCKSLKEAYIGEDISVSTQNSLFYGCINLRKISGPYASADQKCLLRRLGNSLYLNSFAASGMLDYEIESGVTSIGPSAFYGSHLRSIKIPDTLRSIGTQAFKDCEDLKEVHISDLSKWCDVSYHHENNTFPTFIGSPLMYGAKLYLNGSEVTDLVIPDDVTTTEAACFYGCSSITSVTIGSNLRQLGAGAFSNCENLHSVNLEHAENLANIYDKAFSGSAITTISFPDVVSTINYAVCSGCRSLISAIFPRDVTRIGVIAFDYCESAQYYDFSKAAQVPQVDTTSFRGNPSSIKIIVPDSLYSSWKNATNWSALADKIIKKSDWDAQNITE